jgi:hypothetical protein
MLTRCIFIEFPEETVARDGKCFIIRLGTQQKDENQNNTVRKQSLAKFLPIGCILHHED